MNIFTGLVGTVILVLLVMLAAFWLIFPWMVYVQLTRLTKLLGAIEQQFKQASAGAKERHEMLLMSAAQLPPVPGNETYYVALESSVGGPHTRDALVKFYTKGAVTVDTYVLRVGDPQWHRFGELFDVTA